MGVLMISGIGTSKPCIYQSTNVGGICICNETYCDTLDVPQPNCGEYILVTSSKNGKRFETIMANIDSVSNSSDGSNRWLEIDENREYQNIVGFGGAITDAVSYILTTMKPSIRQHLYQSYLSPVMGAAYQILRIPIGATDFSPYMWGYNEQPEHDILLTNITELHPLDQRRAEQIKEMENLVTDFTAKFMFCVWSPPPWMKSSKRWTGHSYLLEKYYFTYALYHAKVLNLWRNEGIQTWSLSTGNEPISASLGTAIPNLGWTLSDQRVWVTDYLRPILKQNHFNNVSILGMDDLRTTLPSFWHAFQQNATDHHLAGIDMVGVHWYFEDLADVHLIDMNMQRYNIPIIYTEGCEGALLNPKDMKRGPVLGSWKRAQTYIDRFIKNFNHGLAGNIDWNLVLNTEGGPTVFENFVDAAILFEVTNQTLYKQPIYYGIAHFSHFLQSNCKRINANLSLFSRLKVEAVAFSCANYTKVIIMHNRRNLAERITVIDKNRSQIKLILDASSVNTLVYRDC